MKLVIADSVWIDDRFIVDDTWIGTVGSLMDAEIYQEKLSTEETMKKINHWIDDRTSGLIDQMLEQPLNEAVRLALINTVYFKGKWEIPFDANDTRREEFYLNGDRDTAVQVDMMNLYLTDLIMSRMTSRRGSFCHIERMMTERAVKIWHLSR